MCLNPSDEDLKPEWKKGQGQGPGLVAEYLTQETDWDRY
jgi:hypothetical protein